MCSTVVLSRFCLKYCIFQGWRCDRCSESSASAAVSAIAREGASLQYASGICFHFAPTPQNGSLAMLEGLLASCGGLPVKYSALHPL